MKQHYSGVSYSSQRLDSCFFDLHSLPRELMHSYDCMYNLYNGKAHIYTYCSELSILLFKLISMMAYLTSLRCVTNI